MDKRIKAALRGASAFGRRLALGGVSVARRLGRDRAYRRNACAAASIAASVAFAAIGIDYLITGGPDWNPAAPRIVSEAHAAAIAPEAPIPIVRRDTMDALAMAPLAPLEEAAALATLSADDLLGGPGSVELAALDLESADARLKAQSAGYAPGESQSAHVKAKPATDV